MSLKGEISWFELVIVKVYKEFFEDSMVPNQFIEKPSWVKWYEGVYKGISRVKALGMSKADGYPRIGPELVKRFRFRLPEIKNQCNRFQVWFLK